MVSRVIHLGVGKYVHLCNLSSRGVCWSTEACQSWDMDGCDEFAGKEEAKNAPSIWDSLSALSTRDYYGYRQAGFIYLREIARCGMWPLAIQVS